MAAAVSSATKETKKADLGLLEDDDDFEEFPNKATTVKDKDDGDESDPAWEDNWDDDNVEDDFTVQLKKHGRKRPLSPEVHSPPERSPPEEGPVAKKMCSRPSPKAATATNGSNGHNGSACRSPARRGRSRGTAAATGSDSGDASAPSNGRNGSSSPAAPRTPTRSSARLRNSRK